MDKRLDQIKEGAGLEESRINEELVEFLKKHSDKFTLVILIAAIAIVGQKWLHQYQVGARNEAWAEYSLATTLGPQNLVEAANKHSGRTGLRLQALNDAADLYLDFVRLGLSEVASMDALNRPGAIFSADYTDDELLSDDQRTTYLNAAEGLYDEVISLAGTDESRRLHVIGSLFGKAAIEEERGEWDNARDFYNQIIEQAGELFPYYVSTAELRLASLAELDSVVMPIPEPESPIVPELNLPGDEAGLDTAESLFDQMLNQGQETVDGVTAPPTAPPADEPPAETGDDAADADPGNDTGSDDTGSDETGSDGSGG